VGFFIFFRLTLYLDGSEFADFFTRWGESFSLLRYSLSVIVVGLTTLSPISRPTTPTFEGPLSFASVFAGAGAKNGHPSFEGLARSCLLALAFALEPWHIYPVSNRSYDEFDP
jgi:hypothetical protein